MKQGKTLVELAQALEDNSANKVDLVAPAKAMHFTNEGKLIVNAEHLFTPTQNCNNQIAERLGIPAKYYKEMQEKAPELLAHNVNHWLAESPDRRMVRGMNGNARAFLSDSYHRIDNEHVLETILPVLMETGGIKIQSCEVTENRMYIKATSTNIVAPVTTSKRVGDFVEAGIMISNSEIGLGSLSIKPFLNFLVCTNGMSRDKLNFVKYHVGKKADASEFYLSDATKSLEDKAILSRVRDVIKQCLSLSLLQDEIAIMEMATQQHLTGDIPKAVEVLGETLQLTQSERSSVLRNLIQSGDLSRYSLMNAVTRSAQDLDSYDRATELEALGGRVLDLSKTEWNRIAVAA